MQRFTKKKILFNNKKNLQLSFVHYKANYFSNKILISSNDATRYLIHIKK